MRGTGKVMSTRGPLRLGAGWLLPLCLLLACATGKQQAREQQPPETWALSTLEAESPVSRLPPGHSVVWASGTVSPKPPAMEGAQPLTMERLLVLAWSLGIGVSGAPVVRNRQVGRALQLAVGDSVGVTENTTHYPTPVRSRYMSVVPDGVLHATRISVLGKSTTLSFLTL